MSEWISVNERAPEIDKDVLLAVRGGRVIAGYLCDAITRPWRFTGGGMVRNDITHWMPYPEAPK